MSLTAAGAAVVFTGGGYVSMAIRACAAAPAACGLAIGIPYATSNSSRGCGVLLGCGTPGIDTPLDILALSDEYETIGMEADERKLLSGTAVATAITGSASARSTFNDGLTMLEKQLPLNSRIEDQQQGLVRGYFSDSERALRQVLINDEGLLVRRDGRTLVNVTNMEYVVIGDNMYIASARDVEVARLYHSQLAGGLPVLVAGEVTVERGRITYIDNQTGHYGTKPYRLDILLGRLEAHGVARPAQVFRLGAAPPSLRSSLLRRLRLP